MVALVDSAVETAVGAVLPVSLMKVAIGEHLIGETSIEDLPIASTEVVKMAKLLVPVKIIKVKDLLEQTAPASSLLSASVPMGVAQMVPPSPTATKTLRTVVETSHLRKGKL